MKAKKLMIVYPIAKINLGLSVVAKRLDGYHDIQTIFYPISLKDELSIEILKDTTKADTQLSLQGISIDGEKKDNIVLKAYNSLKELYPDLPQVKINLKKRIPLGAGLGGGSSDGAFMIKALNDMFSLNLSIAKMQEIASKIGADCAFFIDPKPSYATGKGDILKRVNINLKDYYILIVKPEIMVSTAKAYSLVEPFYPKITCSEIITHPIQKWKDHLVNDFEKSVFSYHKELKKIKEEIYLLGAIYASMSGSGSSLYGIFDFKPTQIENKFPNCFKAVLKG